MGDTGEGSEVLELKERSEVVDMRTIVGTTGRTVNVGVLTGDGGPGEVSVGLLVEMAAGLADFVDCAWAGTEFMAELCDADGGGFVVEGFPNDDEGAHVEVRRGAGNARFKAGVTAATAADASACAISGTGTGTGVVMGAGVGVGT